MIDKESERAVISWLRLGDRVVGRKPIEGRCDRCAGFGYLSVVGDDYYGDGLTGDALVRAVARLFR